ncbi:hypothetical protein E2P81_ATG09582 [Venturia nashicola]|nr:hypothetical protein E2P81_ATG09582 [Venturia nashicola]
MLRTTPALLLALSSLLPFVVSVPVLAQEECVCKPLQGQSFSNSSLASCNKIAEGIQQWRAVAFHSPYLADAFVDAEQGLQVFRDDKAVQKLFRQWKQSNGETTAFKSSPNRERILAPIRPTWPWEQAQNDDKSPGRNTQQTSQPAFLEPAQRYRILCRSRNTPNEYSLAGRPELTLLAGLIIVVVCMTIFDVVVVAWRGYKRAMKPVPVLLGGDEKRIYALYRIEEEEFEDAVVPAISDL